MSSQDNYLDDLLTRLNNVIVEQTGGRPDSAGGGETCATATCTEAPPANRAKAARPAADEKPRDSAGQEYSSTPAPGEFWPLAPADWEAMKLTPAAAEELVLKCLMSRGTLSGREIADHIAVPFGILSELLEQLKANRLVALAAPRSLATTCTS